MAVLGTQKMPSKDQGNALIMSCFCFWCSGACLTVEGQPLSGAVSMPSTRQVDGPAPASPALLCRCEAPDRSHRPRGRVQTLRGSP